MAKNWYAVHTYSGFEEKVKRVGSLDELAVGAAKFVVHEQQPFWLIRTSADQLIALPATCTHLRCILQWEKERQRLLCPCHGGAFDLSGNVVSGPPPKSLQPLRVDVRGGIIYVTLT
ncbi:MAG: Rieske 2Fe-2S domain-containing protein [candidate division WOR-3 bacterium]